MDLLHSLACVSLVMMVYLRMRDNREVRDMRTRFDLLEDDFAALASTAHEADLFLAERITSIEEQIPS